MHSEQLNELVIEILDAHKAIDIKSLNVTTLTTITDYMIVCSATSNRHAKALAEHVSVKAKANGILPLGVEGEQEGEWVLIDLVDVIVHIMLPTAREFYQLEKLWTAS